MFTKHTLDQRAPLAQNRLPWLRKLLGYSFLFFLLKGLAWTLLLAWSMLKALQ